MIYIKCGTCGTSQGYKTAADGRLSLPQAEEARLVARGVAEYVTAPVFSAVSAAGAPAEDAKGNSPGVTLPDGGNAAEGAEDTEDAEGSSIPAYDADMRADYLRSLLKQFEIPCRAGMSKAEMVAALDAVFKPAGEGDGADAEGGEVPPELDAEGPVV